MIEKVDKQRLSEEELKNLLVDTIWYGDKKALYDTKCFQNHLTKVKPKLNKTKKCTQKHQERFFQRLDRQ